MAMAHRILIIGAGIGGLLLARALELSRIEYSIFERAPELRPLGAGLTLQANAMSALRGLGLHDAVAWQGQELTSAALRTSEGETLTETSLDFVKDALGVSSVGIHRGRLHKLLVDALERERVQTGKELVRYEERSGEIDVYFTDGSSAEGTALVGADGLHSTVRRQLLGETALRYSGYTSWRGIASGDRFVPAGHITEIWGRGARFGLLGVGHGETYWFAVVNAAAGQRDDELRHAVFDVFRSWTEPVSDVIDATPVDRIVRTDIHDRVPVPSWSRGSVVLMGDAAHPMTPNLGQGACMAMEDAVVLADCLSRQEKPSDAFADFERRRKARANRMVEQAYKLGQLGQSSSAVGVWLRNLALRWTPRGMVQKRMLDQLRFVP